MAIKYDPILGQLREKDTISGSYPRGTGSTSVIEKSSDGILQTLEVVENTLVVLDGSSNNVTLTLPPVNEVTFQIVIKASDVTNTVKVFSSDGIDTGTEYTFYSDGESISFFPTPTGYKTTG